MCPRHAATPVRAAYDDSRLSSAKRGYGRQWRKTRERILSRDPLCVNPFGIEQHVVFSADVDHIVPREQGGSDDDSNLQGLCHSCHSRKTAIEDGGFGREGDRGSS